MENKLIRAGDLLRALRDDPDLNGTNFALVKRHIEKAPAVVTDNNVGSKWIPVSERLPEEEDANEEGTVLVRYIDESPKYQLLEWHLLWLCSKGISHWMSVQTPPKE